MGKKRSPNTKIAKRRMAKRNARKKVIRKRGRQTKGPAGLREFISDGRLDRWLAHGANFFASDYDEGEWSPLFDEVYSDKPLPSAMEIQRRVVRRYWSKTEDTLSDQGTLVGAWVTLKPTVSFHFYQQTLELLAETDGLVDDVWKPHQGTVWRFLHGLAQELLQ
jgi:hypothetical protein